MRSFQMAADRPPLVPTSGGNTLAVKLYGTRYGTLHCYWCATDTDHTTAWHEEQHLDGVGC